MNDTAVLEAWIGGRPFAATGETFETLNPATGASLGQVRIAAEKTVQAAVEAAREGQAIWSAMTGGERGRILVRAAELLRARNGELARLESLDTGKPIQETEAVDIHSGA
ncbi:MAG TPA: aldehyde dehydrogenase family protein, partial [Kiloniellales bacterium]|nr:aldehyde dehydrogenase family protein [Kiloniellales bacterium]